jgi:hypothetical protein
MSGAGTQGKAPILASLALLVVALVVLQLSDPEPGLLYLAPALVLLLLLAFDRYPGMRLLAVLARAWHSIQRWERSAPARILASPRSFPRGGVLLAMAFAGRGPPG